MKSTAKWIKYWLTRKIDWKTAYLDTWNHPHRQVIVDILKSFKFKFDSILEVGCASGPNLVKILQAFPNIQVGGVDVAPQAIRLAQQVFPRGVFDVKSVDEMFFSDKCADVSLSDMTLIYLEPKRIKKALREMKRVSKKAVVLCEFNSTSWLKRLALRWASGYNAYDYKKLLEEIGFWDIQLRRIPDGAWPGGEPQKTFGYFITARV